MRSSKTLIVFSVVALTAIFSSQVQAQSGSSSIAPVPSFSAPSGAAPTFSAPAVVNQGSGISSGVGQSFAQPTFSQPTFSQPTFSQSPTISSPYSTVSGPFSSNSGSYGPASITNNVGYGGGGCCGFGAPVQSQSTYQPVQSCCTNLGPHGVPSLFTPPRFDHPPVGRRVGRPAFGRWNGF